MLNRTCLGRGIAAPFNTNIGVNRTGIAAPFNSSVSVNRTGIAAPDSIPVSVLTELV